MDIDIKFLQKVLSDREAMESAITFGITVDNFADPETAEAWGTIVLHYNAYDELPTHAMVEQDTGLQIAKREVTEPIDWLCERLRDQHTYGVVISTLKDTKKAVLEDPSKAAGVMREGLLRLDSVATLGHSVADLHEDWTPWLDDYWSRTMSGIPTGFPMLDYATGGYQPEQLVSIIGTPKAGKSTLLLQLAYYANVMHGLRVFFMTFEMSIDEQRLRLACMIAKTDYQKMLNRTASSAEFKRVRRVLERLEDVTPGFYMGADTSGGTTVPMLQQQIKRLKKDGKGPHLVVVDGVYLMESEVPDVQGMDPKALTALTRNLKKLGQHEELPVLISHQALESRYSRKNGLQSRTIGYSSSFAQDSDIGIGIEETDDDRQRKLSIMFARNAAKRTALLEWDWSTSTMEEVDPADGDTDFWGGLDDDDLG